MNTPFFSVSARRKPHEQSMEDFLASEYASYTPIKSVFGFVGYSPLNAGRVYFTEDLTHADTTYMQEKGIALELPMASKEFTLAEYEQSHALLDKHHRKGNIITCYDERLALLIRKDFPLYSVKSSVVAMPRNNIDSIKKALDFFDYVVLPTSLNTKYELLETLPMKEKIVLFGAVGCSANCPKKTCYEHMAKANARKEVYAGHYCSKIEGVVREDLGYVTYDTKALHQLGFSYFKILRPTNYPHFTHVY